MEKKRTRGFTSKFGFVMAAAGSAIGLGNLWSFPYKAGENGGGAFLIVYVAMVLVIGIIGMIAEFYIGKRAQKNVVDSVATAGGKRFRWVGYLCIIVPFVILTYYALIGGWSVKYAFDYLTGTGAGAFGGDYAGEFDRFVSQGWQPIVFLAVFYAGVIGIVILGVNKGIEKASKIMMPLLFLCLIVVIIKGLTLPGAMEGVRYILKPDFSKLTGGMILTALGQVFFSLSLGMGINVAYGSYMKKEMNIGKSALYVAGLDTLMAVMSGLAIFPAVFSYGLNPGQGTGLLFNTLAQVFARLPGGRIFGFVFFVLVILAALTSSIALFEVSIQFAREKWKLSRKKLVFLCGAVLFAVSCLVSLSMGAWEFLQIGGIDLLTLFDSATNKILLAVTSIALCAIVGYKLKIKTFMAEVRPVGRVRKVYDVWAFLLRYVTPFAILIVLVIGFYDIFTGGMPVAAQVAIILFAALLAGLSVLLARFDKGSALPAAHREEGFAGAEEEQSAETPEEGV